MSKPLQWHFEIIDKASGAGKAIAKVFADIDKHSHSAANGVHAADHALGFMQKLHQGYEFAKEKIVETGKEIFKAMGRRETTETAFAHMLGDAKQAREVFEDAEHFAAKTGIGMEQIADSTKGFLRAGFRPEELHALYSGMADIGAVGGDMMGFSDALQQIMLKGELGERQLRALNRVGIESKAVFGELGKIYGISGDAAKSMVKAHAVDGRAGVMAMMNAVEKTISKGELGSAAAKQAGTIEKVMARVKMIPERIHGALTGGGANHAFTSMMENILDVFDPERGGSRIGGALDNALRAVFEQFAGPEGKKKIETIREAVVGLTTALGEVFGILGKVVGKMSEWYDKSLHIGDWAYKMMHPEDKKTADSFGSRFVRSLIGVGNVSKMIENENKIASTISTQEKVDEANRIVGELLGAQTDHERLYLGDKARALGVGFDDSSVSRSAMGEFTKTDVPRTFQDAMSFSPSVAITINTGGGSDGHDFNDLASRVQDATEEALASAMEKLAHESGAR